MKENVNTEELKEAARETVRQLQDELERKIDEVEEVKRQMRVLESTQGLLDEIDRLNGENKAQPEVIDDLNRQLQDKDTQLKEQSWGQVPRCDGWRDSDACPHS